MSKLSGNQIAVLSIGLMMIVLGLTVGVGLRVWSFVWMMVPMGGLVAAVAFSEKSKR